MNDENIINELVEHYKNNLEDAEIIFKSLCTDDGIPVFHLTTQEIQLDLHLKNKLISRFSQEIMPIINDLKRIR